MRLVEERGRKALDQDKRPKRPHLSGPRCRILEAYGLWAKQKNNARSSLGAQKATGTLGPPALSWALQPGWRILGAPTFFKGV